MRRNYQGLLVTFEGGDKMGKTTQVNLLAERLLKEGKAVKITRSPGSTAIGEQIRDMLLNPKWQLSKATEMMLCHADRAQLYKEVLKPNLRDGRIVICDRFFDSTLVYQGHVQGWSLPLLFRLHSATTGMLIPDITFVFVGTPLSDRSGDDTIEQRGDAFHAKVRDAYEQLIPTNRRYVTVNANQDKALISDFIYNTVLQKLESRNADGD